MVDGASAQPGAVTPGKIVVLYGSRIGPANLATAQLGRDGRLATSLGGTQVLFDGTPAPLLYASSGQLAAVVPYSVDGKLGTQVQVTNGTDHFGSRWRCRSRRWRRRSSPPITPAAVRARSSIRTA